MSTGIIAAEDSVDTVVATAATAAAARLVDPMNILVRKWPEWERVAAEARGKKEAQEEEAAKQDSIDSGAGENGLGEVVEAVEEEEGEEMEAEITQQRQQQQEIEEKGTDPVGESEPTSIQQRATPPNLFSSKPGKSQPGLNHPLV